MTKEELLQRIKQAKEDNSTELSLNSKDLTELPPEIGQLTNLQVLYLKNNHLSELPKEIGQLTNLQELYLGENQLSASGLWEEIIQLTNLRVLDLSGNKLRGLPQRIGQLTNLQEFHLWKNNVDRLPEGITKLINLKKLDLRENEILLPLEILNDFTNPQKILNYYFKQKEGGGPLNEAKIVIIGEANVGKTCLINKLVYDKVEETNSTHGIEIHTWNDVKINNENIRLNVWDFGGQEIMHSTHQFFFTKRTIYILVVNARENEDNKTDEWLKRIESFGGNSPIFIVGNKIDENDRNAETDSFGYFDINRRELTEKYKNIKGFYGVCSYDLHIKEQHKKDKCDDLFKIFKQDLIKEIGKLKDLKTQFPSAWFAVKEELEAMQKKDIPFISRDDYIANCIERNVKDKISQDTIIEFLNDLGTVIYFEDLPHTMVFNPEWITKGVYAITDNPSIVQKKGELEISELTDILNRKDYPPENHRFILDIMRKFELCVDIESNKKFLIPDLLPKDEPYTGKWNNTLGFQYHYEIYLKNIFTLFIVRMFPYIHQKTYWRNGVVLEYEGTLALVKADVSGKKVLISIKGDNPIKRRELLAIIRKEFKEIHSKFEVLPFVEKVPHPKFPKVIRDYNHLLSMEEDGFEQEYVKELRMGLPVREWLDGIETEVERRKHQKDYYENPPMPLPPKVDKTAIELAGKKIEIEDLQRKIGNTQKKISTCDEAAKRISRFYTMGSLFILAAIIGIWIYVVLVNDWNFLEPKTYILPLVITVVSYGVSAWTLKEWNPLKFPEQKFEKERKKFYEKFDVDIEDFEFKKNRLKQLGSEVKQLENRAFRLE